MFWNRLAYGIVRYAVQWCRFLDSARSCTDRVLGKDVTSPSIWGISSSDPEATVQDILEWRILVLMEILWKSRLESIRGFVIEHKECLIWYWSDWEVWFWLIALCCFFSETYQYYDLPFCKPDHFVHKSEGLGEVLEGDRMVNSRYNFTFKVDKSVEDLCTVKLSPADIVKFKKAVEQDYYFQVCNYNYCSLRRILLYRLLFCEDKSMKSWLGLFNQGQCA